MPQVSQAEYYKGYSAKESQLLYAGYLFVSFTEYKLLPAGDMMEFLKMFGKRVIASTLPSCVKSFLLPIAC